jgi:hypothetical protein
MQQRAALVRHSGDVGFASPAEKDFVSSAHTSEVCGVASRARPFDSILIACDRRCGAARRPESLKIVAGSGQAKLDESALKTIRASVPFDPPPREMTVAIAVAFGQKR